MARFPPQLVCPHNPNIVHEGPIVQADDKSGLWVEAVTGHDSGYSWQVEKLWVSADKNKLICKSAWQQSIGLSEQLPLPLIVIHYLGLLHQELLSVSKGKYTACVVKKRETFKSYKNKEIQFNFTH